MTEFVKLVPVHWATTDGGNPGGTKDYEVPEGWEFVGVEGFRRIDGNAYRALIVLRKTWRPDGD